MASRETQTWKFCNNLWVRIIIIIDEWINKKNGKKKGFSHKINISWNYINKDFPLNFKNIYLIWHI